MTDLVKKIITKFQAASGLSAVNGPYFGKAKDITSFPFAVIMPVPGLVPQYFFTKTGDYVLEKTQIRFNILHTDLLTLSGYQEALHTAFDKTSLTLTATGDTFVSCLRTSSPLLVRDPWLSKDNDPVYLASTVYEFSWTNSLP